MNSCSCGLVIWPDNTNDNLVTENITRLQKMSSVRHWRTPHMVTMLCNMESKVDKIKWQCLITICLKMTRKTPNINQKQETHFAATAAKNVCNNTVQHSQRHSNTIQHNHWPLQYHTKQQYALLECTQMKFRQTLNMVWFSVFNWPDFWNSFRPRQTSQNWTPGIAGV